MSFDWKAFALGLGLAVLSAALEYAQVLPAPYGSLAAFLFPLVAHFAPSSLGKKS